MEGVIPVLVYIPVVFTVVFGFFGAGGPREDDLCGLRYSSVHHREVGVSRSDLRGAQGRVAHTWPLRLRWLGPEVCAYAG